MQTLEFDGITFNQAMTVTDMKNAAENPAFASLLAHQSIAAIALWREILADLLTDPASARDGFIGSPNEALAAMVATKTDEGVIGGIAFDFTAPETGGEIQIEHIHVASPHRGNGHLRRLLTAFKQINDDTRIEVRAPISPVVLPAMEKYAPEFVALDRSQEEVDELRANSRPELRQASGMLARRCRAAHRGPHRGTTRAVPCRSCATSAAKDMAMTAVIGAYELRRQSHA